MNEKDTDYLKLFPPVSTEAWEAQINTDLKGKDYEKTLVFKTNEGIKIRPYYRSEDLPNLPATGEQPGQFPFIRGKKSSGNSWLVRQDIIVNDYAEANRKAVEVLTKGVDSLGFVFQNCNTLSVDDLRQLLNNIDLSKTEINLVMGCNNSALFNTLMEYCTSANIDPASLKLSLNYDPIGRYTLRGKFCQSAEAAFEKAKSMIDRSKGYDHLHILSVNGVYFTNAGASVVQELAFSLAIGAEYLTRLSDLGVEAGDIACRLRFNFGIGSNYFMELAKLRAARLLWSNIVMAYQPRCNCSCNNNSKEGICVDAAKMYTHCETSTWNKSVYDPYVNMLRTQTEAMSAILGGTDSLTVLPFDSTYGKSTDFSERIARNQQALLREEAHFDKIADPAAGSYYIEHLTDSIAEEAWKLFLTIEEKGGYLAAFKEGFIQQQINTMASAREKSIASRRENILGVNQFPNFNEQLDLMLASDFFQSKSYKSAEAEVEPIRLFRGAQQLEALRYATDSYSKTNGRPKAFMLTIGAVAMRKARAQFSCNFFAAAGYEVIDNNGFETIAEGVNAALEAGSKIIVLCSSDDEYALYGKEFLELTGNHAIPVIAGAPACMDELKAAGLNNFIHVKSNLLDTLREYNQKLGIA